VFSISSNEERYEGQYDSEHEAIAEAAHAYALQSFWIGELVEPTQPEELFEVRSWLDHVSESWDYEGEWAENWDRSTLAQREELEAKVRAVMAEWLDRHNLRPAFFNITKPVKYLVVDGVPVLASTVEA